MPNAWRLTQTPYKLLTTRRDDEKAVDITAEASRWLIARASRNSEHETSALSLPPVAENEMAWRSGDVIGCRRDELATTQMDNRNLDCTLRQPGGVRDRAHTGTDGDPFGSCGLGVKVQINEIRRRFLVVAD